MRYYLSLLGAYAAQYAKSRLEYRADLLAALLMTLAEQLVLLAVVLVVFRHVPTLQGWTRAEILFIYGYFLIPWSLFDTVSGKLWDFGELYVVKGEMDRLLTRPVPSMFQLLMEGLTLEGLIGLVSGSALMLICGKAAGVTWQGWDAPLLLLGVTGSFLVYLGVYMSAVTLNFFSDSKSELQPMIFNINYHYGRYPVDFYNRPIRFLISWVLPFAFVGVYPAAYFLRREPQWLGWALLTPMVGAVCTAVALWLWRRGVQRYHGAGS